MGDLDWVDNVPAGIRLEPDTFYYFEPPLNVDEVYSLANRSMVNNNIKYIMYEYFIKNNKANVKYFVTDSRLFKIEGWCNTTEPKEALSIMYKDKNVVNGREVFKF